MKFELTSIKHIAHNTIIITNNISLNNQPTMVLFFATTQIAGAAEIFSREFSQHITIWECTVSWSLSAGVNAASPSFCAFSSRCDRGFGEEYHGNVNLVPPHFYRSFMQHWNNGFVISYYNYFDYLPFFVLERSSPFIQHRTWASLRFFLISDENSWRPNALLLIKLRTATTTATLVLILIACTANKTIMLPI